MGDEIDPKLKLYIRLPVKIEDEVQIKDLHPDIIKVYVPRQKARKWCVIAFADNESLEKAKDQLKAKKIKSKNIFVRPFTQRNTRSQKLNIPSVLPESMLDLIN